MPVTQVTPRLVVAACHEFLSVRRLGPNPTFEQLVIRLEPVSKLYTQLLDVAGKWMMSPQDEATVNNCLAELSSELELTLTKFKQDPRPVTRARLAIPNIPETSRAEAKLAVDQLLLMIRAAGVRQNRVKSVSVNAVQADAAPVRSPAPSATPPASGEQPAQSDQAGDHTPKPVQPPSTAASASDATASASIPEATTGDRQTQNDQNGTGTPNPAPPSAPEPLRATHSNDFTSVNWYGTSYTFKRGQQVSIVEALWKAMETKTPTLSKDGLAEAAGSSADDFKIGHVFRDHPAYKTMIISIGKGIYRLAEPPKNPPRT